MTKPTRIRQGVEAAIVCAIALTVATACPQSTKSTPMSDTDRAKQAVQAKIADAYKTDADDVRVGAWSELDAPPWRALDAEWEGSKVDALVGVFATPDGKVFLAKDKASLAEFVKTLDIRSDKPKYDARAAADRIAHTRRWLGTVVDEAHPEMTLPEGTVHPPKFEKRGDDVVLVYWTVHGELPGGRITGKLHTVTASPGYESVTYTVKDH